MANAPDTDAPVGVLYPKLTDRETGRPDPYWHGGAGHELEHWRRRALAAEARVRELEMAQARAART